MNTYLIKLAEMLTAKKGRKTKYGRITEPDTIPTRLQGGKVHASATVNAPVQRVKAAAIHIKPSHKGLLHKNLGEPRGKKLSVSEEEKAKKSSDPAVRKRATFALNARKWNHGK
jgi:hypothetical protein